MPEDVEPTIATLRDAARALRSVTSSPGDEVRAIETAIRALQAAKCDRLAEIDRTRSHEAEGASSIGTWARRELNQDAGLTRQMVRAAATFRDLPAVAEAARSGSISFEHVTSFTYALKHVGVAETRLIEEPLLDVAKHVTPSELHAKVRQIRAVLHPDDLDEAWRKGMDKRDIRLARTDEGWHVTGFLDVETGAKLNTILKNLSVPRDADDDRSPSERRMGALDDICTTVLEHGLPADNGIRPHINVTVTADLLKAMAEDQAHKALSLELEPAVLHGFGPIGPGLLAHLLCGADLTPFLITTIGKNTDVLDVGRTERPRSPCSGEARRPGSGGAATERDEGARPGHHHLTWWSHGGRTDLDNLIGLCRKCHNLIHTGRLELARGSPVHARAA